MRVSLAAAEVRVKAALAARRPGLDIIEIHGIEAPSVEPWRLLSALPEQDAYYLKGPGGLHTAAVGTIVRVESEGTDRAQNLAASAGRHGVVDRRDRGTVRWCGGLAFERDAKGPFGAGSFGLARFSYEPGRISVAIGQDDGDRILDELGQVWAALVAPEVEIAPPKVSVRRTDEAGFRQSVTRVARGLASDGLQKVVLSRRLEIEADRPFIAPKVLARLSSSRGLVYGFRRSGQWFLGATPERLIVRQGRSVRTEALAGSAAPSDPSLLLHSKKDRLEHALVVGHLLERLAQFAVKIERPPAPEVLVLPYLMHLLTPMSAELERPLHVLEIADRLQPTPAVAGTPIEEALAVIRREERGPRGWYTGAVGWFDPEGQGELWVGLRSALLVGRHATLQAGVGLVPGSTAEQEWRETEWKAEAMKRALEAG